MGRINDKPVTSFARSHVSGLQSIAHELNLSASLVSKVLNNRLGTTRVSDATQKSIRERAKRMGYTKNHSAAALVSGRQGVIGVFVHPIGVNGSGLQDAIVQSTSAQASLSDQRLLLHFFTASDEFDRQRRWLHPSVMDGAILAGVLHQDLLESLVEVQRGGTPIVTIYDRQMDPNIVNIGPDQQEVGRLGTAHLIAQGCRRIAHINVMPQRRDGYDLALREAGLQRAPELVYGPLDGVQTPTEELMVSSYSYGAGVAAANHFLSRGVDFDGLVAQSDQQAAGALHSLLRAGKRVPEDVKIIGVDDSPLCTCSVVELSSICQDFEYCGRTAVESLNALIRGESCSSSVARPILKARRSSGASV